MSYVDRIPEEELAHFTIVEGWGGRYNNSIGEVEKLIVRSDTILSGKFHHKVEFTGCYFQGDLIIKDANFFKDVYFNECFVDGSIIFNGDTVFEKNLHVNFLSCKAGFWIKQGSFNRLIAVFKELDEFIVSTGKFEKLWVSGNDGWIKTVYIDLNKVEGRVDINHAVINGVTVLGYSNALLTFNRINTNSFKIDNFKNNGEFRLINIRSTSNSSQFKINNSYLGKAEFYTIDFKSFDLLDIHNSNLVDSNFVNIKWKYDIRSYGEEFYVPLKTTIDKIEKNDLAMNIKLFLSKSTNIVDYYKGNREVFRQIKYALQKQGSIVHEHVFLSRELRAHNKALRWKEHPITKLIIKFSYWFSDFGQSMWRPLMWLGIGHFILFLISIKCGMISSMRIDIQNPAITGRGIYEYFYFINPLHKTEDLPKNWTIIIDIFMRIWSSYMIYNIIRASRRFIK